MLLKPSRCILPLHISVCKCFVKCKDNDMSHVNIVTVCHARNTQQKRRRERTLYAKGSGGGCSIPDTPHNLCVEYFKL